MRTRVWVVGLLLRRLERCPPCWMSWAKCPAVCAHFPLILQLEVSMRGSCFLALCLYLPSILPLEILMSLLSSGILLVSQRAKRVDPATVPSSFAHSTAQQDSSCPKSNNCCMACYDRYFGRDKSIACGLSCSPDRLAFSPVSG